MQTTTNYNLNKPESADYVLVEKLNENMDTIDAKLKELETEGGGSVTVDTAISSTSENPVQNKVIEKYLEPVLGKPQESGVPTVNLTGSKYPINDVADGGKRFRFVTYNENNGGVTYCEIVLNTNVGSRELKLGFYKRSDGSYLPFIQQTSTGFDNLPEFNVTFGRYDVDGNTTDSQGAYKYNWNTGYNDYVRSSTSSSAKFNIPETTNPPSTVMFSYKNVLIMTHLAMLEGELYTGEGISYNGNNLYGDTPPVFVGIPDCNVTYNGSTATTPWEQIQEDVAELKNINFTGNGLNYTTDATSSVKTLNVDINTDSSLKFTSGKLDVESGSTTKKGVWKIASNGPFKLDNSTAGNLGLKPATSDTLGGVKVGDGLSVTSDGTLSASGGGGTGGGFSLDWKQLAVVMSEFSAYPEDGETHALDGNTTPTVYLLTNGVCAVPFVTVECYLNQTGLDSTIEYGFRSTGVIEGTYDEETMNIPDNGVCTCTPLLVTDNGSIGMLQIMVRRSGTSVLGQVTLDIKLKGSGEVKAVSFPMYPFVISSE